jgi:hypothetical protein
MILTRDMMSDTLITVPLDNTPGASRIIIPLRRLLEALAGELSDHQGFTKLVLDCPDLWGPSATRDGIRVTIEPLKRTP